MKPARSRAGAPAASTAPSAPAAATAPAAPTAAGAAAVPTAAERAALYSGGAAAERADEAGTLPDLQPQAVAVAAARQHFAHYIRRSAEAGEVFLIRNGRSTDAPSALLISPQTLARHLAEPPRAVRTLGTLLDSLPYRRRGVPRASAALHDAEGAPPLTLPAGGSAAGQSVGQAAGTAPR